jgi:hypothetical protein
MSKEILDFSDRLLDLNQPLDPLHVLTLWKETSERFLNLVQVAASPYASNNPLSSSVFKAGGIGDYHDLLTALNRAASTPPHWEVMRKMENQSSFVSPTGTRIFKSHFHDLGKQPAYKSMGIDANQTGLILMASSPRLFAHGYQASVCH